MRQNACVAKYLARQENIALRNQNIEHLREKALPNSWLEKSNEMQQYADIYLLLNYSTCFGRPSRPSSVVHKTVLAASGTDHTIWEASLLDLYQRLQVQFYVLLMMGAMDARNM